jgi:hypothetical protein
MNQIEEFNPPPNPTKFTDSRATGYIAQFGYESWELDALDPTTIAEIIRTAVDQVRDDTRWRESKAEEDEGKMLLNKTSSHWEDDIEPLLWTFYDDEDNENDSEEERDQEED